MGLFKILEVTRDSLQNNTVHIHEATITHLQTIELQEHQRTLCATPWSKQNATPITLTDKQTVTKSTNMEPMQSHENI